MSRINQNVGSMVAQRVLSQQNMDLSKTLNRLSTGLRIVRGSDDPAGLIASENLRAEKAAINSAMNNAERAEQVVNVAEGGLQEISSMLVELQSLVTSTANEAGVSTEEKEANQLQIDSILQSIDWIANRPRPGHQAAQRQLRVHHQRRQPGEIDDLTINSAKLSNAAGLDQRRRDARQQRSTGRLLLDSGTTGPTVTARPRDHRQRGRSSSPRRRYRRSAATAITFSDALGVQRDRG